MSASSGNAWITDRQPDDQMTVLLRTRSEEWPIQIGFKDGDVWRDTSELLIVEEVLGWMDLEVAAIVLDGKGAA